MMHKETYIGRRIDSQLEDWKNNSRHKLLLLRGTRQVGKSSYVCNLGSKFDNFIEVNFEKRPELHYWENLSRGATAEVDFVITRAMRILPIEIKPGVTGRMKSLRLFIDRKNLTGGVSSSLENFGILSYKSENDS